MKLLLDTHTFLWLIDGNSRLGSGASTTIEHMHLVTGDSKLTSYSVPIIW